MNKNLRDLAFPVVLLAVSVVGFLVSLGWGFRTRIFPVIATIALAVFCVLEIVNVLVRKARTAPAESPTPTPEPVPAGMSLVEPGAATATAAFVSDAQHKAEAQAEELEGEASIDLKATLVFGAWLVTYALALYVLGFLVGGVAMTLVYMVAGRREKPVPSVLVAAGVGVVIWAMQSYAGLQIASGLFW